MSPERLADKVADLLQHRDIDFEDYPVFSSHYYVTVNLTQLCLAIAASLGKPAR
jgi:hypothetical protein